MLFPLLRRAQAIAPRDRQIQACSSTFLWQTISAGHGGWIGAHLHAERDRFDTAVAVFSAAVGGLGAEQSAGAITLADAWAKARDTDRFGRAAGIDVTGGGAVAKWESKLGVA